MALTQLGLPYPIFTDLDGTPLDGGLVYIGLADDNPETNPILVYYDQELTQVAPQPLRTVNGYVMRNGSPAILYSDDTFSVTVRNKNGVLVLYAAQSFGFLPGGGLRSQNNLSDVDSAATSLVNLGLTATATELNHTDGVTSNIQTQLDSKQATVPTQDQTTWDAGTDTTESLISPAKLSGAVIQSGQWTPNLVNESNVGYTAGSTPLTQIGTYFRIGDLVFANFQFSTKGDTTDKPPDADRAYVSGLPFLGEFGPYPSVLAFSSVLGSIPSASLASVGTSSFLLSSIGPYVALWKSNDMTNNGPGHLLFSDLPAIGTDYSLRSRIIYVADNS